VALEDVPFGEPLTPQVLRLESWPKDKIPAGGLARIEDVEGRRCRSKLYAGEPVLENKLFAKGASEQGYSTVIPKGYRVVAVKVDRVSGSGLILPGDRVDVLVHLIRNPSRGILKTSTRTILQNVRVFAVNDVVVETTDRDEKKITAQTISLLVSPEHAQLVMLAEESGKIRLIMRSPEDNDIATVEDTTPSELLDAAEAENRQDEDLLAQAGGGQSPNQGPGFLQFLEQMRASQAARADSAPLSRQAPGHEMHRMRIVSGSEIRDVVLEKDDDQSGSGPEWWRVSQWQPPAGSAQTTGTPDPAVLPPQDELAPAEKQKQKPQDQKPQPQKEND
jgi:pilus assembly protein CpaB